MSNPFAGFTHSSHINNPNAHLQGQNIGGHPGFGASGPNGMNIFGPQTTNGGLPGGFGGAGALGGGGTGLASQAAQLGFAHGAQLQQAAHDAANAGALQPRGLNARVREVWANNLEQEMDLLGQLIDQYPYVSMVRASALFCICFKTSSTWQWLEMCTDVVKESDF
jgi:CCR4-NOT transcription complex subunit 7/8